MSRHLGARIHYFITLGQENESPYPNDLPLDFLDREPLIYFKRAFVKLCVSYEDQENHIQPNFDSIPLHVGSLGLIRWNVQETVPLKQPMENSYTSTKQGS